MNIAILSNVNVTHVINEIKKIQEFDVYTPNGYGIWLEEIINPFSELYNFEPEVVFFLLDGSELFERLGFEHALERLEIIVNKAKVNKNIHFFIPEIDVWDKRIIPNDELSQGRIFEEAWNKKVYDSVSLLSNIHVIKLKSIVEYIGRKDFYSDKLWYLGGIKFSNLAVKYIIDEIKILVKAYKKERKKVLIIDLDNTLWGGVVGEVGVSGIELSDFKEGRRFKDFQNRIKEMKETGVILAIASKNNENDVKEVFENHKDMVLEWDDIVSKKINWENKVVNIKQIAEELNLGIDSFVFIDDSPMERELVKENLPCEVPDFPTDTSQLNNFAIEIYRKYFYTLRITEEDKKKTQMYLAESKREELKKSVKNIDEFLESLEMKMKIWKAKPEDVSRIAELTQKTNQFNLTTIRLTEAEVLERMEDENYDVYLASVEDKFGDYGKVLLAFVKKNQKEKTAEIENILMSCRVFGRNLELQFLEYIQERLEQEGIEKIYGKYIPTAKNKPAEDFYERMGYRLIDSKDGIKTYEQDIQNRTVIRSYARLEYEN